MRQGLDSPDLVLMGHIVQETIYFPGRTLGPVLGSPVAYGSVVAGRLGEKVGIVTTIGTDMPAELLAPFREAGVDLRGLRVLDGNWTTTSQLIYQASGSKEIRYPRKAPPIEFEDIPPAYYGARVIYVACMDRDVPLRTIRALRRLGAKLAVDLGAYGGAHSVQHPDAAEQRNPTAMRELVGCFDIVRASLEDCAHLLGPARVQTEADEERVLRDFLDWGADVAVLTLGERGCAIATPDGLVRAPAQRGQVVDTTGAGDSFSTAFLSAYMQAGDVTWAARFGAATVIHIIEHSGGVYAGRMPTRADVEARLAS